MVVKIDDEDVSVLAGIATMLKVEYVDPETNIWEGSPFEWIIRLRSSRQRGKIGEQLIAGWCAARDLDVGKSPDSDADKIIEGKRVEIKFSTLWENGTYTFQQIRDQNYDTIIFLGVSPFDAHCWIFNKKDIPFDQLRHQHGGTSGRDTWWLKVDPKRPQEFLQNQTGRLAQLVKFFSK